MSAWALWSGLAVIAGGVVWWRETQAVRVIKAFEDLSLTPYRDSGGVWTIGWGHKILPGESYYPYGDVRQITPSEADRLLAADAVASKAVVAARVTVPLSSLQRSALVSFTFNVGSGAFERSTLLKKLNAGDYTGAAAEFSRWNHDNGKVVAGLTERRAIERAMFTA